MKRNAKTLRVVTVVAVIAIITVGFVTHAGIGTLSAIGWSEISLLCPLGALGTMLATKMMVPQAVISLIFAVLFIIVLGRAFCAWACPVPLVGRLRNIFKKKAPKQKATEKVAADQNTKSADTEQLTAPSLTAEEKKALEGCSSNCSSCAEKRGAVDSRHFILGGSLLSAAIFGFPVFCLVCPIGLTFATILLLIRLFSNGDVTLSLIVVPLILIAEVVLFKKWCHKLCPLSAFMSIIGKANRTFKPTIDDAKCIETSQGRACGVCGKVCEEEIDPRHPQISVAKMNECTRCRACVDACPADAISMPFLAKQNAAQQQPPAQSGQA